jgi:hypothetical protein
VHHLKYAHYIEKIEAGFKSNPRCFFKFANLKRNSMGLRLLCFWVALAHVTQIYLVSSVKVFM